MQLLKYGFETYDLYEYAEQDTILTALPVENGLHGMIDVMLAMPGALIVPTNDFSSITVEIDLPEKINAPVYQGQKLGEIIFSSSAIRPSRL